MCTRQIRGKNLGLENVTHCILGDLNSWFYSRQLERGAYNYSSVSDE